MPVVAEEERTKEEEVWREVRGGSRLLLFSFY